MMITSVTGFYARPAQAAQAHTTLTPADALPASNAGDSGTAAGAQPRFRVSDLKKLDVSGLKAVSIADIPELRDRMATMWLDMQAANASLATDVPDNAPQNVYATVKVNGRVVATLYNGGSSAMTNEAAASVGGLQDPPGLIGGPDLAQWRAEQIARAVGGTIEKAPTAITQSAWTPRQSTSTTYTRAQLDAAFEAMTAERQMAIVQRPAPYPTPPASGNVTDFSA